MCCLCSESLCFAVHWTFSTSCHRAQHRSLYPRSSRAAPLTWPNGTVHQELSKAEGLAASQTLDASGKDVSLDNSSRPGMCPQDVNTPHCSALNLSILASQSVLSSSHSPSLQYLSAGNDLLFVPMETHWVPAGITYSVIIFSSKSLYRIHDTLPASLSPPWSSFFLSSFLSPFLPFFPYKLPVSRLHKPFLSAFTGMALNITTVPLTYGQVTSLRDSPLLSVLLLNITW